MTEADQNIRLTKCQVKCDCIHPVCSECSKRDLICEYQGDAVSDKLVQASTVSSQGSLESGNPSEATQENLDTESYSCQFAGDTLSILNDPDEVKMVDDQ